MRRQRDRYRCGRRSRSSTSPRSPLQPIAFTCQRSCTGPRSTWPTSPAHSGRGATRRCCREHAADCAIRSIRPSMRPNSRRCARPGSMRSAPSREHGSRTAGASRARCSASGHRTGRVNSRTSTPWSRSATTRRCTRTTVACIGSWPRSRRGSTRAWGSRPGPASCQACWHCHSRGASAPASTAACPSCCSRVRGSTHCRLSCSRPRRSCVTSAGPASRT